MAVFAIIAPSASGDLSAAIAREFPGEYFMFGPGQYVVNGNGSTTREVSRRIGDTGQVGQMIVFQVGNWWGWHNKDLWEWLGARSAQ